MKNLKINDEAHFALKNYCDLNNLKINDWVSNKIIELTKNYTYVEITPRQSGKTTRLINHIVKQYNGNLKHLPIVIVTVKTAMGNNIKNKLELLGVETNDIMFTTTMNIPNKNNYEFYVDEFDFIDRSKLFISNNGYYCSTLKDSEGDDFTKELYQTYLNSVLWKK